MKDPRIPRRDALDAVLLDAGGVLVNPDWTRVAEVLSRHGVHVQAEALGRAEPAAKRQLDRGEVMEKTTDESRAAGYFGLVLAGTGWTDPVSPAAWESLKAEHARRNLWRTVLPGVPEALSRLRAAGLRLAVVSNANGTVQQLFDELELSPYFDVLLDSFVEGLEKPDPLLFERALLRLEAKPERTIHAGDFYHLDVVGARRAGIAPVLIDAAGLYDGADCPRVASLPELVDRLLA